MKLYNFELAKQIIKEKMPLGLKEVSLGMKEDWFFTSDVIWNISNGFSDDFQNKSILSISSSDWATPTIELIFKDGKKETIDCFIEE